MPSISKHKKPSKFQKWFKKVTSNKLVVCSILLVVLVVIVQSIFPSLGIQNLINFAESLQWSYLTRAKQPPPLRDDVSISTGVVKKIHWDHSQPPQTIINDVIDSSMPVLIKNGPANFWPIANWDILDFLMQGNDIVMEGLRWQREPVFVLGRDREKGGMLGSPKDRPLLYINSSMASFLNNVFNASQYYYWSGELSALEDVMGFLATKPLPSSSSPEGKSVKDLDWKIFKHVDSELSDSVDIQDDELWVPNVWFSHPGVVAQTHYDPQHNFLSQVQGRKRVILFPPSEQAMYLYPHIHRSYRQSQLHLEKSAHDPQLFPSLPTSGMEVILKPGDSLYIPPYWHHRVESLTMSISISVTSPAHLEAAFSEISWQTVPFGKFTSIKDGKAVAVKLYFGLLFTTMLKRHVVGNIDMEGFSKYLFSSRYAALYPPHLIDSMKSTFSCPPFPEDGSTLLQAVRNASSDFQSSANTISTMLQNVKAHTQLKREFLGDYMEELVRWAVGPAKTAVYIHECLK